jgi:hypothetical protein
MLLANTTTLSPVGDWMRPAEEGFVQYITSGFYRRGPARAL